MNQKASPQAEDLRTEMIRQILDDIKELRGEIRSMQSESKSDRKEFYMALGVLRESITGNGRASKQQVQRAVQTLLSLHQPPEPNDVADAIAAAMCCANEVNRCQV